MIISLEARSEIARRAAQAAPEECCGFIIDGAVVPCKNSHPSPEKCFAISAEDYAVAEERGTIQAIYHSHPGGVNGLSSYDIKACKQSNIPWLVYHIPSASFYYADPTGEAPYEGRQWIYGINDCYGLVRDFYKKEFGISLDDFERGQEFEWSAPEWQMFASNYEKQGFYEAPLPYQKGDVVLMQIGAPSPNHVGVVIGDGCHFYHHLIDKYSEKSVYGGYWARVTAKVLRHKSL